ncbi:MAG TPA: cytochrome P450 [Myxococcota bacterium]|nr:cytochrome P450 [Myxococcota bacterium]
MEFPSTAEPDYFTSKSLVADPYPYFDRLRRESPVRREPHHDVFMVTGYDEAAAILADPSAFSSCNALSGPFPGFPVPLEGDDVSELVEAHRDQLPMSRELTAMDPPRHSAYRALVARYFTPKHIGATEPFMRRLADRLIDAFIGRGECELLMDFSKPFSMLNICALLGVPECDHPALVDELLGPDRVLLAGSMRGAMPADPFAFLHERFRTYIEDRRTEPRDDVMTSLISKPFPDESRPELMDAVRLASLLFIAGIDTTAGSLASAFQLLGERPDLQQLLRDEPERIPNFLDEMLRIDSPLKGTFRLARVTKTIGGVEIPAGSTIMLVIGAANRDPRKFECPDEFRVDRKNARQHLAFGSGVHTCVGAPLARAESRVGVERALARLRDIRISERVHGPVGARTYKYVPGYLARSLRNLHLEFTPASK